MNPNVVISFTYEKNLPKLVSGNLEKFKLAMMTALEFSTKYCQIGNINVKVDFDSLTDNRERFVIKLVISIPINQSYPENHAKPLIDFLNNYSKKKEQVGAKSESEESLRFMHKNTM